jgi:3-dehydroquinate synthase
MEDLPMSKSLIISSKIRGNYTVHFIENLKSQLRQTVTSNAVFLIDEVIKDLFKDDFEEIIGKCRIVLINAHEKNKTIDYAQEIIRKLIDLNIRKDDSIIAIGGGITQDLATFVASILFRGVDWKFYPTTLLAQCDSCIGSKSSINFDHYKNLLGTFNPPSEIFIYSPFLVTLSESEIRSGIGEMLHYFLSEGIDIAKEVSKDFDQLLTDRSRLTYFIENSLRIKKAIIEIDEFDTSIRHIFNYGHTFGHAIEAITNYAIPHGQSISIGMDLANYISYSLNMISLAQFNEMHEILIKNIPPFKFVPALIPQYFGVLSKDKKNKGNKLGCILTRGAGKLEKVFIDIDNKLEILILEYSSLYSL